jgi:hypothetical protein
VEHFGAIWCLHICEVQATISDCRDLQLDDRFVRGRAFWSRALHHPNWAISELELVRTNIVGADSRMGAIALLGLPDFWIWTVECDTVVTLA